MLELDELQTEIVERGLGWNATRTSVIAGARRRGGGAFLGVRVDPDVARAQAMLATAAPASKYDTCPPPADADWRQRNDRIT